jgi:hypothetical protein
MLLIDFREMKIMSEKFNVHIQVLTAQKLATIMSVLDGEAKLVSVEQIDEKAKRKVPLIRHRVNGERGIDIALETCKGGGETTTKDVEKIFVEKGLNKVSAAPRLSQLVSEGKLVQIRRGVYKIAPKSVK